MNPKIVAVAMNGMNSTPSTRDMDVVYPMAAVSSGLIIDRAQPVQEAGPTHGDEYECSTLYWHLLHTLQHISSEYEVAQGEICVHLGRGKPGGKSESDLRAFLKHNCSESGKNAFKVIVAKSYGAIDTLKTLHNLDFDIGTINLLLLIDATAPSVQVLKVSTKKNSKGERLLRIPRFVARTENIYQRSQIDNLHWKYGYQAKDRAGIEVFNHCIESSLVDGLKYRFPLGSEYHETSDHQGDVEDRVLTTNHFNMEEIVCGPGVLTSGGNEGTLHDLILDAYSQHYESV